MTSLLVSLLYPLSISIALLLICHSLIGKKLGVSYQYLLWSIVPLSLLAYLLPLPFSPQASVINTEISRYIINPSQNISQSISDFSLVYIWLSISALMLVYWGLTHIKFERQLSLKKLSHQEIAQLNFDGWWPQRLKIYQSELAFSPMLVGIIQQKLVLPKNFQEYYNYEQQQLILQHEICHFDRNDIYWNLIAFCLVALFWFHPLVWLGYFRFRRDQELSCDAHVLARKHVSSRVNYSKALLVAAQTAPRIAFAQLSFKKYGDKAIMFERIKQIKMDTKASKASVSVVSLLAVVMLSGFSFAGNVDSSKQQFRTPPKAKAVAKPIMRVEPKYPAKAVAEKLEGSVVLKFDVNVDGSVSNVEVMNGQPAYVFDGVAIAALKQWKYQEGQSIVRNNLVQLDFKLSPDSDYKPVDLIEKIKVVN